jgi:hypothetical protein
MRAEAKARECHHRNARTISTTRSRVGKYQSCIQLHQVRGSGRITRDPALISGMSAVCPMTARAVVGAQFVTALVGDSTSSDVNKEDVD